MYSKQKTLKLIAFAAVLTILGFALYFNSLNNSFHYDDKYIIVKNTKIYEIERVGEFFTSVLFSDLGGYSGYRPLVMTSFALDYHFFGPNPVPFRLVNLLFHIMNAFLVFLLVLQILPLLFKNLGEDESIAEQ